MAEFCLGVHDDRPVPRDRLLNWLAGDEQEADAFRSGLDLNLIAAIEQDQGMVRRVILGLHVGIDTGLGEDRLRSRGIAKSSRAGENVGKRIARGLHLKTPALVRRYGDVDVVGVCGDTFDRPALAPRTPRR